MAMTDFSFLVFFFLFYTSLLCFFLTSFHFHAITRLGSGLPLGRKKVLHKVSLPVTFIIGGGILQGLSRGPLSFSPTTNTTTRLLLRGTISPRNC